MICHPCDPFKHGGQVFGYTSYPIPMFPKGGKKCDICGSTAIDHTEVNCLINRLSNPAKEKERSYYDPVKRGKFKEEGKDKL